jgi:hypothetical protein
VHPAVALHARSQREAQLRPRLSSSTDGGSATSGTAAVSRSDGATGSQHAAGPTSLKLTAPTAQQSPATAATAPRQSLATRTWPFQTLQKILSEGSAAGGSNSSGGGGGGGGGVVRGAWGSAAPFDALSGDSGCGAGGITPPEARCGCLDGWLDS